MTASRKTKILMHSMSFQVDYWQINHRFFLSNFSTESSLHSKDDTCKNRYFRCFNLKKYGILGTKLKPYISLIILCNYHGSLANIHVSDQNSITSGHFFKLKNANLVHFSIL